MFRSSGADTFPSTYTDATLNAKYVDYVVRGQGEDTLLELLDALRGARDSGIDSWASLIRTPLGSTATILNA